MQFNKVLWFVLAICALTGCEGDSQSENFATGQGGSMTRFAINGNYLYIVDHSSIEVFDIAGGSFLKIDEVDIGPGMETIFARGEYLYLGALDGMYIYSIADPQHPSFIFRYSHVVSCDPVVVQGDRAYVTLRTGTSCNLGTNALEIIDISDRTSPKLITNYSLTSPHGLGVKNNLLFICEGPYGFRVLDMSDETTPKQVQYIADFHAYDVIVRESHVIITGEDGVFQYAFSADGTELTLHSKIPVNRTEL
jgi:hypothetical protein